MYKSWLFYRTSDFQIKLELVDGELFVHLTLWKVNRHILDDVLKVWAEIKARAYWQGYEAIYTYTRDTRMFKFFPFAEIVGTIEWNGESYEVAKWELN